MIQHLSQLREEAVENYKKKVRIFNPTKSDFTCKFNSVDYTIPSLEIKEFDYYVANHIKKHLADKIINDERLGIVSPEKREEIYKTIEVTI